MPRITSHRGASSAVAIIAVAFMVLLLPAGATAQTCAPAPSGMVSWYTMEGSANDVLGANNPSATSATSFVAGEVSQGVTLGSGGYIDIPDSASLDLQVFTLDAWVRPDGAGPNDDSTGSNIINKGVSNGSITSLQLSWRSSPGSFRFAADNHQLYSSDAFPPGAFYHVAATYDGAVFRLYVNGAEEASLALVTTINYESSVPWVIGANPSIFRGAGYPRTFNGVIDEVEIIGRALSSSEVAALYAAGSAGKCYCGNSEVQPGEECDDGNTINDDGCDNNCTFTACGNGVTTSGEQCDDGNTSNGDCCSNTCQFEASGEPCIDDANPCTTESCDGAGVCTHPAGNSGAVCRPLAGDCDVQETCDGSATCPPDEFADSSVVCRISAGDCDLADHCSGAAADCPDVKSTAPCRPAAGDCDLAENCDGVSNACPADILQPDTFPCRVSLGACDLTDYCTGAAVDCPADAKSTDVCRNATGACDVAESCDGVSNACPANGFVSNGTTCNDGNTCTSTDQCSGGACIGAALADGTSCSDGESCTTADQCSGGVCGGSSRADGAPCDDGNACTSLDQCFAGACTSGSALDGPSCNDGNACTSGDHCVTGSCEGTSVADGTSCISPNDCTSGGQCAAGVCDSSPQPNGTPCNDHNFCTGSDQCLGGTCNGAPVADGTACDDTNSCTNADQCGNGRCGGVTEADSSACDDGNSCTANDECNGAFCAGLGVPNGRTCSDGQSCTTGDQCMSGVCQGAAQSDGTPCNDGTVCTSSDQCTNGVCGGTPSNDGAACSESCTSGTCDTGVCQGAPATDGTLCSDGAVCTRNDACTNGVCTGEPGCVDPYLCYKTKLTFASSLPLVLLHDEFETTQATVSKPKDLCLPADADGEGVVDPVTHQQSYPFKQVLEHTKQLDITVTDAFGTLELDTVKPARLLVPTNKQLGSPPSGPPAVGVADHFKCYGVKITKDTTPFPKGTQVTVTDQFQMSARVYDVKKPKMLCNPVDKNGEGIQHSLDRLVCYQVKPTKGEAKFAPIAGQIFLHNQFGPGRVDAIKENVLCVAATEMP